MPTINYLTRIEFDFGAIASLGAEIERMGLERPLLVTDRGIADAGILQRALDAAAPSRPAVYDGTTENPTEQSLLECLLSLIHISEPTRHHVISYAVFCL